MSSVSTAALGIYNQVIVCGLGLHLSKPSLNHVDKTFHKLSNSSKSQVEFIECGV